jgi:hypothetical protein
MTQPNQILRGGASRASVGSRANRKLTHYCGPISGYAPDILRFFMAKQVAARVVGQFPIIRPKIKGR